MDINFYDYYKLKCRVYIFLRVTSSKLFKLKNNSKYSTEHLA